MTKESETYRMVPFKIRLPWTGDTVLDILTIRVLVLQAGIELHHPLVAQLRYLFKIYLLTAKHNPYQIVYYMQRTMYSLTHS